MYKMSFIMRIFKTLVYSKNGVLLMKNTNIDDEKWNKLSFEDKIDILFYNHFDIIKQSTPLAPKEVYNMHKNDVDSMQAYFIRKYSHQDFKQIYYSYVSKIIHAFRLFDILSRQDLKLFNLKSSRNNNTSIAIASTATVAGSALALGGAMNGNNVAMGIGIGLNLAALGYMSRPLPTLQTKATKFKTKSQFKVLTKKYSALSHVLSSKYNINSLELTDFIADLLVEELNKKFGTAYDKNPFDELES